MKFAASAFLISLVLAPAVRAQSNAPAQSAAQPAQTAPVDQEPHHQLMYATGDMQIYDVVVPSHQSALMYPQNNNYISITLAGASVTISSPGGSPLSTTLPGGAVRYAVGGSGYTLTNDGGSPYEALEVEFFNAALLGHGCSCTGSPTDSICSCPNAPSLPPAWSLEIGHVLLRGVTLASGATYDDDSTRATRFLVPLTPFDVMDTTVHEPRSLEVRLPAGGYHWLGPGPHQIQNLASTPLVFVCVEF
jgi:hypothetical protein